MRTKASIYITKLIDDLDTSLAILGVVSGFVFSLFSVFMGLQYIEVGIAILLGCLIYLFLRRKPQLSLSSFEFHPSLLKYLIFNAAFFALFSYSLIVIKQSPEPYVRPTEYFVSTAVLVGILALEIFSLPQKGRYAYYSLMRIVLISLTLQWIPQLMFPDSLVGVDVWGHRELYLEILSNGSIPQGFAYSKMPVMHLLVSLDSLITNLDYKYSLMFSVGIPYLSVLLFVFLIGRRLFSLKVGLLASVMLAIADRYVHAGISALVPYVLGLPLTITVAYIVLYMKKISVTIILLVILLLAILLMTNPVATLIMFIILFCIWAGAEIYRRFYRQGEGLVHVSLVLLCGIGMLAYWSYITGYLWYIALSIKELFQIETLTPLLYLTEVPYLELLVSRIGLLLFFWISMIGSLALLSKWLRNHLNFCLLVVAGGIGIPAFSGSILGLTAFLPERWFAPLMVFLAVPLVIGLIYISRAFKAKIGRLFVVGALTIVMTFFMITSPFLNTDNPIYTKHLAFRHAFTDSEMEAVTTVSRIYPGVIVTDGGYSWMQGTRGIRSSDMYPNLTSGQFGDIDGLIMVRQYTVEKNMFYGKGGYVSIDYDIQERLSQQGFNRTYDCGTVAGFLKGQHR